MGCKIRYCTNDVHGNELCAKHYRRDQRKKHPIKAAYANLRSNAKRRGKEFTITFPEFCKFAIKVRLLLKQGREAESYTVDRVDNNKGYTIDNIQLLTLSDNSKKYQREKKLIYDWQTKYATVQTMPDDMDGTDTPY